MRDHDEFVVPSAFNGRFSQPALPWPFSKPSEPRELSQRIGDAARLDNLIWFCHDPRMRSPSRRDVDIFDTESLCLPAASSNPCCITAAASEPALAGARCA